ncbi:ciliogenesis-associated TTC17-interacting protein-like isoform X2 [Zophobas morio]|uniref:ciliogenesis-associated TTC17-interacting protein-like isoform X2 n=1 Tax=Zophobas morio TaxID=2755281 RepID=UPI003083406E
MSPRGSLNHNQNPPPVATNGNNDPRHSLNQDGGSRRSAQEDESPKQSLKEEQGQQTSPHPSSEGGKGLRESVSEEPHQPATNLSALWEEDEPAEELSDQFPSGTSTIEDEEELLDSLIKPPSIDYDEPKSACALLGKVLEEGDTAGYLRDSLQDSVESISSGLKIAGQIMSEIFKKSTKPKPRRKMKKPIMKSGWMRISDVIPNFDINDEIFKNIMFSENLLVSTFDASQPQPVPVGGLCLDIQRASGGPLKYQNKKTRGDFLFPKFLVHLSSQLDYMGHNGGSRITAWVDRDLQTLEEKRREYLHVDEYLDQQILYVNSQENFYYLRHDKNKDMFYSPKKARNLICEGSNFILMRYLAMTKFVGTFETTTLYIDGSLCRNIYECKGPSSGVVNNKKLDVCKIYRTIIEECGIEHRCIALMTLNGQILKQEWQLCDYLLQLNPLIQIRDDRLSGIPLEFQTDDMQLLSLYLDSKVSKAKHIQNYMEDHPEIKAMLSDYVQTILHLKPEDVFEFTAKYFLSFTPALLPQSEYFEAPHDAYDEDDYEFWKYL